MKIKTISEPDTISKKQMAHYIEKWIYMFGGAPDVVSLEDYIQQYNSDVEGDVDIYSTSLCPCILCINYDESNTL